MGDKKTSPPAVEKAREPVSGEAGFDPTTQPAFQEYPKWITTPGGLTIIVSSAAEEAETMKKGG